YDRTQGTTSAPSEADSRLDRPLRLAWSALFGGTLIEPAHGDRGSQGRDDDPAPDALRRGSADLLVESLLEQIRNRIRALLGLLALGSHGDAGPHGRRQHQHAHDALAVDRLTVLHQRDVARKPVGGLHDQRSRARVHAQLVAHRASLLDRLVRHCLALSIREIALPRPARLPARCTRPASPPGAAPSPRRARSSRPPSPPRTAGPEGPRATLPVPPRRQPGRRRTPSGTASRSTWARARRHPRRPRHADSPWRTTRA